MLPDTILSEPFSLSPVEWLIYADNRADCGDSVGEEWARCIAKGLEKTGGELYLHWDKTISSCHNPFYQDRFTLNRSFLPFYHWLEEKADSDKDYIPTNPVNNPHLFLQIPEVVKMYWDKLAEIGARRV